jgi:hypothetical protein
MRQLTSKQKKLLDKVIAENKEINDWDELPIEIIEELERINNTEILWSETNRYISDKRMKEVYKI